MNTRTTQAILAAMMGLGVSLLAACSAGPQYKRPAPPTAVNYVSPAESAAASGATASPTEFAQQIVLGGTPQPSWWSDFKSSPLDDLIAMALQNNHTLAMANSVVAAAQELVKAQSAALLPQVAASADAGRQQYGTEFLGPTILPPFSYVSVGASVSYAVDYNGGIARSVEEREALAQYVRSQKDVVYLNLTGSVVQQAVMVAATRSEIEAVNALIGEDENNLKLVRTAFDNGSVSRVDVLTAESQLATDQTWLPPLRQQLAISSHALAVLVGHSPAEWTPPEFDLANLTLPREIPVSLPSELAHRRPDILAAEAQLHAATAAVGIATANLYPRITLSATGGFQALKPAQLFDYSSTVWGLIAGLTTPVFDGGRLRAERRATINALHASAERYQQVVLESFGQVANGLDALNHDAELVAAQSNAVNVAQRSVDLARESFREGNSGILQVLDAQRQHEQAKLGLLRAQAQQYLDTTKLYLALGGTAP